MKLMIVVVQNRDSANLRDSLIKEGFKTTVISTTGGFLREGSTTFLIGTQPENVEKVIEIIKKTCKEREMLLPPIPPNFPSIDIIAGGYPSKVIVGGATVFVLDVEEFRI